MTVNVTGTKIVYQGNGATTQWSYAFPGGPGPDIHVFVNDPVNGSSEITSNLLVVPNPPVGANPTSVGGTVTYPVSGSPLPAGSQLTILRDVPTVQPISFANQGTLYQQVIEESFDRIVMDLQEIHASSDQQVVLPPNETGPLVLPACPQRANKILGFDANCQPVAVGSLDFVAAKNAIRVPEDETLNELPSATNRPGTLISFDSTGNPILIARLPPNIEPLFGARQTLTGPHAVINDEKGFLFILSGNIFYDLSLGDPAGYDVDFSIAVFNADVYAGPGSGRAKRILFNGTIMPGGLLWPGQWVYIFKYGSGWVANPRDVRWKPGVAPTFFVDPVSGADDGTSDGLATGVGATKTITAAVAVAQDRLDYGGILTNFGATVQLAGGTYKESVYVGMPTVGGNPIVIRGAADGGDPTPYTMLTINQKDCIQADLGASLIVRGISFKTGSGADFSPEGNAVAATNNATVDVANCRFGPMSGPNAACLRSFNGSHIEAGANFIVGSVPWYVLARRKGSARLSGNLTVSASLTFTEFLRVEMNSTIDGGTAAFDQTNFHVVGGTGCVGARFRCQYASTINLGDGVAQTMPGNAAGILGGTAPNFGSDYSAVW